MKRLVGLAYAESISDPEEGLVFLPGVGLVFKVPNPQRHPDFSAEPRDHIQTVKAYLKRLLRRADSGRVGGRFTPVRVRYSHLTKGWTQGKAEGAWRIVATDWEVEEKGASYGILWTPPATIVVKQ